MSRHGGGVEETQGEVSCRGLFILESKSVKFVFERPILRLCNKVNE